MRVSEERAGASPPGEVPSMAMASARPAEALAREYGSLLLQMARRLCVRRWADPEDLVQETFEKALQDYDRLSRMESGRLRGWLCTTLGNRFIYRCRRG